MNSRPMILRFCSGSETPASADEELLARIDRDEAHAGRGDVVLLDLLALALAQQPVVDEDCDELVADRLVHERGRRPRSRRRRRAPQITRPEPTCSRMRATCSAITLPLFQSAGSPAASCRKFSITRWP